MNAGRQITTPAGQASPARDEPAKRPKPRPLGIRLNEAAEMLGVARTTVFAMIKSGKLEAKKIGAATIVTYDSIEAFWAAAPAVEATKRAQASIK